MTKQHIHIIASLSGILYLFSNSAYAQSEALECLLEPNKEIELSSPVQGVVESILVKRGDHIEKGQLLLSLHSELEKAQVQLAKARADFGSRTKNRNTDISNLISDHEKDEIETDAELAKLELKEAQARLEMKHIYSPIDGIVKERLREEGEYVSAEPVLTLVNIDPLYVEVIVPVSWFGRIKENQSAELSPEQPIGGKYTAKVLTIDKLVDAGSGTFRVRLTLPNPEGKLPSGLRCQIQFLDVSNL